MILTDEIKEQNSLLLADHTRFSHMLCREEDRCNLLVDRMLKLLTAAATALVALFSLDPDIQLFSFADLLLITGVIFASLCVFGVATYTAIVKGQLSANRWRVRLDMIRDVFQKKEPFQEYDPFNIEKVYKRADVFFDGKLIGGSSTVAMILNMGTAAAAAGILALLSIAFEMSYFLFAGLVAGVFVFAIQFLISEILKEKSGRQQQKESEKSQSSRD